MAVTDPKPMSRAAAVAYAICSPLGLIALVFLPVGRLDWKTGMDLRRLSGRSVWRLRSHSRAGQSKHLSSPQPLSAWDETLGPGPGRLDLFRHDHRGPAGDPGRWSHVVVIDAAVILGYALLGTGIALSAWAQAVNPFFEPGVRVQRERGQQVISKGPYATVRHPGYAGAIMIFAGLGLSLASWGALMPATRASLILIVRTKWEDDLLRTELEGYSEYVKRTRYRLFPHLW